MLQPIYAYTRTYLYMYVTQIYSAAAARGELKKLYGQ